MPFLLLLFERVGDFGRRLSTSCVSGTKLALLFGKRLDHSGMSNNSTPAGALYWSSRAPLTPTVNHPLLAVSGSPNNDNRRVPKQKVSMSDINSVGLSTGCPSQ